MDIRTTKEIIEEELTYLRETYVVANEVDKNVAEIARNQGEKIKQQLSNMCYQCHEEPRTYNVYFCSEHCNNLYYPLEKKRGGSYSIEQMQLRLQEMAKEIHERKQHESK